MDLDHAPNNIGLKDELEEAVEAEIVEIEHYSK